MSSSKRLALALAAFGVPSALVYRRFRHDMTLAYQRVAGGGQFIATSCGPVQYAAFGSGAPLLIIHGAGGGYDQGTYFARLIGGPFRWIAPSRFGFLGSPTPDGADSALQADTYAALLDALAIPRVGIVGISMGGPSALLFAAHYPERTTALAMLSAASHAIPPRPPLLSALFDLFLDDFVFWAFLRASPATLLAALGVPPAVQHTLSPAEHAELDAFLESILPMAARRQGQQLEQHMSGYDPAPVPNIRAPTLVLHARDDTLVPFDHGEFTARQIPNAELVALARGGHLALMLDQNAPARHHRADFLTQHNP